MFQGGDSYLDYVAFILCGSGRQASMIGLAELQVSRAVCPARLTLAQISDHKLVQSYCFTYVSLCKNLFFRQVPDPILLGMRLTVCLLVPSNLYLAVYLSSLNWVMCYFYLMVLAYLRA